MKLMDRYVVREFLQPLFYCLFGFSMIYVICDLFGHASRFLSAKPPFLLIVKYYLCLLSLSIEYIIPASLLFATLYTLWQMTRRNELTAMRATGVSLYRVILPLILVGLVFTGLTAGLKEFVVPAASVWRKAFADGKYKELRHKVIRDHAFYLPMHRRVWVIGELDTAEPHRFKDITVRQERADKSKATELTAQRAEWLDGQWWFYDSTVQRFSDQGGPEGPVRAQWDVKRMATFDETPADFLNEIWDWTFLSSRRMERYLDTHPNLSRDERAKKETDLYARGAMPWSCLIVILFGIPAGARSHRQSPLVGIFTALACFFAFHGLTVGGIFLAKTGVIQPWLGAWLSNIVFFVAGMNMIFTMR